MAAIAIAVEVPVQAAAAPAVVGDAVPEHDGGAPATSVALPPHAAAAALVMTSAFPVHVASCALVVRSALPVHVGATPSVVGFAVPAQEAGAPTVVGSAFPVQRSDTPTSPTPSSCKSQPALCRLASSAMISTVPIVSQACDSAGTAAPSAEPSIWSNATATVVAQSRCISPQTAAHMAVQVDGMAAPPLQHASSTAVVRARRLEIGHAAASPLASHSCCASVLAGSPYSRSATRAVLPGGAPNIRAVAVIMRAA